MKELVKIALTVAFFTIVPILLHAWIYGSGR